MLSNIILKTNIKVDILEYFYKGIRRLSQNNLKCIYSMHGLKYFFDLGGEKNSQKDKNAMLNILVSSL